MKKILFIAVTAVMAFSSCQSSKVNIAGRFVGLDADMVYLEQSTPLEQAIIDSVSLNEEGEFKLTINDVKQTPSLYYICYNNERLPLLLSGGDNITVSSAGNLLRNYEVEGSQESELLQQFTRRYVEGAMAMNDIISKISASEMNDDERKKMAQEYTRIKHETQRFQLGFIIENKANIAAVYALHQRLPNESNLFNGNSDIVYYRTVVEALEQSYPETPYLPILRSQVARMDAQINLLSQVTESNFPDIEMPDMYGKKQQLSTLSGKVILLHFWSAGIGNSNALNADLKEIYGKYHDQGFEIFQVAVDTSKSAWVTAVQEQQLPWISVSDLLGNTSPTVGVYNVKKLPTSYLIDRKGNIVAKDLVDEELDAQIKKLI
ncbi:MAG: AhpC/TSA family protein [Alistipes sp.]|nr:AhpC/TSA family protein [Alistipes sp.]MBQ5875771.1 AhpC/TSA family protein [Alistipes sp.]